MNTPNYYIGLMSGTSLDGIDASLCEIDHQGQLTLIHALTHPYPDELRQTIQRVSSEIDDSLHMLATLDHALAEQYADVVFSLLGKARLKPNQITAVGNHGQTVRHCPDCEPPYTIQLGNPHKLAALCGIRVVADFRQQDMMAGGQGAPLAPKFHQNLFAREGRTIVALNLGGIANISILHSDNRVTGFDTGPANTLMDQWINKQLGKSYDQNGEYAKSGRLNESLLKELLQEPWLQLEPPKSTGPELFNLKWLTQYLRTSDIPDEDVQRTLCEFTATTISQAIEKYASDATKLVLCGGGTHNVLLRERLATLLPQLKHASSDHYGISPDWIESCMMAWLAYRALNRLPGNIPAVTGASHEVVLGTVYQVP